MRFRLSVEQPNGDRGGNLFFIRVREERAVIDLHQLWDGLLTGLQTYKTTGKIATELRQRPAFARAKPKELQKKQVKEWYDESVTIARDVAYAKGKLKGGTDRSDGPVLPADYATKAKAIAERQVVLAGYRLAAVQQQSH